MTEPTAGTPGTPGREGRAGTEQEAEWQRLDKRMLLIHPIQTFVRALPALLAIFVVQLGSDDSDRWELIVLPVIVAFGLLRWVTTRYRISADQIELRRGLLNKQTTTARLDKVRSVDLTAEVHHRLLGLARVEVSTGSAARERLVLDSLGVEEGRRLRAELLHRVDPDVITLPPPTGQPAGLEPPRSAPGPAGGDEELLRLEPSWVRFAPFTMTGIGSAAAIFGFASQGLGRFSEEGYVLEAGADWVRRLAWWVDVLGILVLVSALAIAAYLLSFWGFRLTRNRTGSLHTRRGLLTSREVGIDHTRVRGVELGEPLGLRLAGARRLKAVSTGLQGETGGGSDWLAPPAPRAVVLPVATAVTGDAEAVSGPLVPHGPAARRRRLTRAMLLPVVVALALGTGLPLWDWPGWLLWVVLPLGVAGWFLGLDRYAGLGHAVTPAHLVSRSGSLDRNRVVLTRNGVIGWKVRQSFFQRRAGVVTLVATTAAGQQHYDLLDLTTDRAYELVDELSPELFAQFPDACATA
ncbi:MAG TPA: PH domain-containing protein [Intrasporangium sp.]|uniref:PH domain-containing protein n=1 Tax=Intrasporangium sp. TaxID=1925024 RepID=UPI002B48A2E8|nr:PH domain-containing protein [Intrasporangium sp.]HKX67731.1 PH domain-containing protein [Intrasporangium sp.]